MLRISLTGCILAFEISGLTVVTAGDEKSAKLISARAETAPTLDGSDNDGVWTNAKAVEVVAKRVMPGKEGSTRVSIKSVYTDTEVFFLFRWEDTSKDDASHKTWVWNKETKKYEDGPDREDAFAIAFEFKGPFNMDMLAGVESEWDVWHWKAFRTNPQGFAMDRRHIYTLAKPEFKAKEYKAKNGKKVWIARPEDAGDTVEKKHAAPTEFKGDKVPQYSAGSPTKSAADVRAKGAWAKGHWTLEMSRKLDTGFKDDVVFSREKTLKMAVAPFQKTGDMDMASGVIELSFSRQ
ncbi:MAG: ethylbenzene dehydrogenase-related protein [Gemmataceae bacterium]|nr:ethylbenzene dehydrogenase-related protein [Gemmataceae bacterium]MCI0740914.1 ethylbenzene dehydrogenase-related protein [Gemmataceae bacterium]